MTKKQEEAVKALEMAFKGIKRAKLSLVGIEGGTVIAIAMDETLTHEATYETDAVAVANRLTGDEDDRACDVDTHQTFLDMGCV